MPTRKVIEKGLEELLRQPIRVELLGVRGFKRSKNPLAGDILQYLHNNDVVIKTEGFPDYYTYEIDLGEGNPVIVRTPIDENLEKALTEAGCGCFEPLIEE